MLEGTNRVSNVCDKPNDDPFQRGRRQVSLPRLTISSYLEHFDDVDDERLPRVFPSY